MFSEQGALLSRGHDRIDAVMRDGWERQPGKNASFELNDDVYRSLLLQYCNSFVTGL